MKNFFYKNHQEIVYRDKKLIYIPYKLLQTGLIKPNCSEEFLNICAFFNTFLIDRTQSIDTSMQILKPLPIDHKTSYSFADICSISAKKIVQKSLNKQQEITLLWSGGIDSTTALIAIFKELKTLNKTHLLKIILSQESIDEFPIFFKHFIKKGLCYKCFTAPIFTALEPQSMTITGELGDQIFGGNMVYDYLDRTDIYDDYPAPFEKILFDYFQDQKSVQNVMALSKVFIEQAPFSLKSLYDVLWWFSFAGKWQVVSFTMIAKSYQEGEMPLQLNENIIHFFDHNEFQKWAIQNRKNQTHYTVKNYKYQAKEYIYAFFPDQEYLRNKRKEKSLKKVLGASKFSFLY